MQAIVIEPYTDQYKEDVAALIIGIQQIEFGIPITLAMQPDLASIPEYYQVNAGNFWIARSGATVVGTVALLDIGNHRGALRKMFVHPQYRGKTAGTAQSLLMQLIDWSREQHIREVFLGTTAKFTAAQRFYEKNGFVEIEQTSLPSGFPIMSVDIKFYKLVLHN
jgi:N-acetylglutamate synthase-like GNAT family acetyltransferase